MTTTTLETLDQAVAAAKTALTAATTTRDTDRANWMQFQRDVGILFGVSPAPAAHRVQPAGHQVAAASKPAPTLPRTPYTVANAEELATALIASEAAFKSASDALSQATSAFEAARGSNKTS